MPPQPSQKLSETATADDIFGALGNEDTGEEQANILSLKQPPKWLRRPVTATFGFGGLLVSTSNLPGASGKHQSGVVHLRSIVTEQGILDRATALSETAGDRGEVERLCESRSLSQGDVAWKTLQTLFKANSRSELTQLLGFSKEEVAKQVSDAIAKYPSAKVDAQSNVVKEEEVDVAPVDESQTVQSQTPDAEKTLFDDDTPGTPGADFFSSMAAGIPRNRQLDSVVPHQADVAASSVAATIGSRASSVRSEAVKDSNTFRIYPHGESEVDKLITQALVIGDFVSAVDLCLASERFADALLLAVRGGAELLQSTQKAYFARRTSTTPFLRVFQSIVTEDITDIVQNADLSEWKVVFVVLCTFAKEGDFSGLAEQLGQRLQFRWQTLAGSDSPEAKANAKQAREDATLCYLAARRLEKVVGIWVDEMSEEEDSAETTKYTAHAEALQSFIEKVSVFTAGTGYIDEDLMSPTASAVTAEAGTRTYKLAGLYDRYYEYADLLATQGMIDIAATYVQRTPSDYRGTGSAGSKLDKARDRLLSAADTRAVPKKSTIDVPSVSQQLLTIPPPLVHMPMLLRTRPRRPHQARTSPLLRVISLNRPTTRPRPTVMQNQTLTIHHCLTRTSRNRTDTDHPILSLKAMVFRTLKCTVHLQPPQLSLLHLAATMRILPHLPFLRCKDVTCQAGMMRQTSLLLDARTAQPRISGNLLQ